MWFGKSCFQLGKLLLGEWRKNVKINSNVNRIEILVYLSVHQANRPPRFLICPETMKHLLLLLLLLIFLEIANSGTTGTWATLAPVAFAWPMTISEHNYFQWVLNWMGNCMECVWGVPEWTLYDVFVVPVSDKMLWLVYVRHVEVMMKSHFPVTIRHRKQTTVQN